MQPSINSQQLDSDMAFLDGAISDDELERGVGGLARAWVEQRGPAPARPDEAMGSPLWDPPAVPAHPE